jgi:hypothetical protein
MELENSDWLPGDSDNPKYKENPSLEDILGEITSALEYQWNAHIESVNIFSDEESAVTVTFKGRKYDIFLFDVTDKKVE